MTVRYDEPTLAARAGNGLFRWLAEAGISIAGTQALAGPRAKDRQAPWSGDQPADGRRPRLRGVAARQYAVGAQRTGGGVVEMGPRWRSREVRIAEVSDDAKPDLLKRYLDRWFWEVKGHVGGLTPHRPTTTCGRPPRRSRCSSSCARALGAGGAPTLPDAAEMTSSRACWLATCQHTAAGYCPHVLLNIPMIAALPSGVTT